MSNTKDMNSDRSSLSETYHILYERRFKAKLGPYLMRDGIPALFDTKAEAIKAVRSDQTFSIDSEDYAIVREGEKFAARQIRTINSLAGDDLDDLSELETVVLTEEGKTVIASIVADSGEVRHFLPLPNWKPAREIKTVDDVKERLIEMKKTLSDRGDPRVFFPSSYKATTKKAMTVIDAIRDPNHPLHDKYKHLDDRLIENFVIEFGKLYFEAFDNYERGDMSCVPSVWKVNFDEAKAHTTTAIEELLLGFHAHISYDVGITLSMKLPDGNPLYNPKDPKQVETFNAFNQILIEEADTIIRYSSKVDAKLGGISTNILDYGKSVGVRVLGAQKLEDVTRKVLELLRTEAEKNSIELVEGRMTIEQFKKNTEKRSRAISKMLPNTGRLFKKQNLGSK